MIFFIQAISSGQGHDHGGELTSSKEENGERIAIMKGFVALGGVYFFFMAEKILSLTSEYRAEKKLEKVSFLSNFHLYIMIVDFLNVSGFSKQVMW